MSKIGAVRTHITVYSTYVLTKENLSGALHRTDYCEVRGVRTVRTS